MTAKYLCVTLDLEVGSCPKSILNFVIIFSQGISQSFSVSQIIFGTVYCQSVSVCQYHLSFSQFSKMARPPPLPLFGKLLRMTRCFDLRGLRIRGVTFNDLLFWLGGHNHYRSFYKLRLCFTEEEL